MSDPARHSNEAPLVESWGRKVGAPGLVILLFVYLGLSLTSASGKSVTVDELGHLPSGLYYLRTGDPRYASLNPPLLNVLSALPALAFDSVRRSEPPEAADDAFSFWTNGYAFLDSHHEDYVRIYAAARWVPVWIGACLGVLLFVWARRLAPTPPNAAGLLAVAFVCLSPNVIAQARLVGTDSGTAFFMALAVFAYREMLLRPTRMRVLLCGLALGLAQLTKFYALLLYPALIVVTIAWHFLSKYPLSDHSDPAEPSEPRCPPLGVLLGGYAAAAGLSLLVLNTGYLWQEFGASLSDLSLQSSTLTSLQSSVLGSIPIPLPGAYVRGFDGQLVEAGSTIPSYLFGESFEGGRGYYYLGVLAIKTPLPLFAVFVLALFLSHRCTRLPARELVLLLTAPVLLFALLSLGGQRQLGSRALLCILPLVQLWVAATIARSWPRRWPLAVAGVASIWLLAISIWTHPNYLSYFNVAAGGSDRGYLHASDANVDLGQDLVQLAEYLETEELLHPEETGPVQLLYFGSVDPALYGIDYVVPSDYSLHPGLFAVSVSLYRMSYYLYDHGELRRMGPVDVGALGEPIAKIGGSIHVYRIRGPKGH